MEEKSKIKIGPMPRKDLAAKYGVRTKTIYNWLKRDGLYTDQVKNKLIPAEVIAKLIEKRGYWEVYLEEKPPMKK